MTEPTHDLYLDAPLSYNAPPLAFKRSETDDELLAIPNPDALGLIPTFTPSTTGDNGGNS